MRTRSEYQTLALTTLDELKHHPRNWGVTARKVMREAMEMFQRLAAGEPLEASDRGGPHSRRSMLDAVRHAVETGDALRPAAWGLGAYLIVSPRAIDGSVNASIARLRNPITQAPADLDLEDMLGPWVTLPIKDAQIEAATRAADGEEVR